MKHTISMNRPPTTQPILKSLLRQMPDGLQELHLQGRFYHPHWLAFLLSGLAQFKISLVSGTAQLTEAPLEWDALLRLDFQHSATSPEQIDYGLLAEKPAVCEASPMQLSTFQITRRPDKALEVRLQGPDQLGFVGRFLTKVSLLGLYPSEVKIDTVAGRISDRIVLNGIAGSPPAETAQAALDTMLRGLRI
jgi:hypothetical protein